MGIAESLLGNFDPRNSRKERENQGRREKVGSWGRGRGKIREG